MPKKKERKECPRCKEKAYVFYKKSGKCYNCNYYGTGKRNNYKKQPCPDCLSKNIIKIDKSKGRHRWYCKDCGASWWDNSKRIIRPSERKEFIKFIKQLHENGFTRKQIVEKLI